MIISAMLMGLATLGIGVLPNHAQIGTASALLLVVLRILQGFSVGGDFTDSASKSQTEKPNRQNRKMQRMSPLFRSKHSMGAPVAVQGSTTAG
jgi:MFS family permease